MFEQNKPPKLILIWSMKGGAGKSTCIHNICTALGSAPFNYEIMAADADKQVSLAAIESEGYEVSEVTTNEIVNNFDKVQGYDYVFVDLAGSYDEETKTYGDDVEAIIGLASAWFIPFTTDHLSIMGAYQTFELLADFANGSIYFFENMVQRRTVLHRKMSNEIDKAIREGAARKMKYGLPQYQLFKKLPKESIYNGSLAKKEVILFRNFINEFNDIIK